MSWAKISEASKHVFTIIHLQRAYRCEIMNDAPTILFLGCNFSSLIVRSSGSVILIYQHLHYITSIIKLVKIVWKNGFLSELI